MFYVNARLPGSRDYIPIFDPEDKSLIILAPKLTVEMGKAGSFQFQVPSTHQYYNQLLQLRTIVTVMLDDIEIFRGRVLTNKRSFNNLRTVYCEGDLSYLLDSVQKGQKFNGKLGDLFTRVINEHNERVNKPKRFEVGTISNSLKNRSVVLLGKNDSAEDVESTHFDYMQIAIDKGSDNWDSTFDFIQSVMIDYAGGYLRTRYNEEENKTYIDYLDLADYTSASTQPIEFGVNMLDLTEEIDAEDVFTVLIPLGDDNLTIAKAAEIAKNSDGSNIYHLSGSDELVDGAGVNTYGRIVKTNTFSGVTKPATLLENAKRFIENHENMPTTFTIKAVDMHFVDPSTKPIQIGDKVSVISAPHDIGENDEGFVCSKIEYDLSNPANNAFTFGIPKQTLTDRYKKDKKKTQRQSRERTRSTAAATSTAAVTEATATAAEDTDAKLEEFRKNAWVYVDEEGGTVELRAIHDWLQDLRTTVGIDLHPEHGVVDIFSMYGTVEGLETSYADMRTTADATHAQIDLLTRFTNRDGDTHTASIMLYADELGSRIDMKADQIDLEAVKIGLHTAYDRITDIDQKLKTQCGIDIDAEQGTVDIYSIAETVDEEGGGWITSALADVRTHADETHATVDLMARFMNQDGDYHSAMIQLSADALESRIDMKADVIDLEAIKIGLHTTYDRVLSIDEALKTQCGIDIDSSNGTIDIFSIAGVTGADGSTLSESLATITTHADEDRAYIDLSTRYWNKDGDDHSAMIKLSSDALESRIDMKADVIDLEAVRFSLHTTYERLDNLDRKLKRYCGIDVDASMGYADLYSIAEVTGSKGEILAKTNAYVKVQTDDFKSSVTNAAEYKYEDPTTGAVIYKTGAYITATADALGSRIDVKADKKITLESGEEVNIETQVVNITASMVTMDALTVNGDSNLNYVYAKKGFTTHDGGNVIASGLYCKKSRVSANGALYPLATESYVIQQIKNAHNFHTHSYTMGMNKTGGPSNTYTG